MGQSEAGFEFREINFCDYVLAKKYNLIRLNQEHSRASILATGIHVTAMILNNLFCQINPYHVPVVITALSKFQQKYSNDDSEKLESPTKVVPFNEKYIPKGKNFIRDSSPVFEKPRVSYKHETSLFKSSKSSRRASIQSSSPGRRKTIRFTVKPEGFVNDRIIYL